VVAVVVAVVVAASLSAAGPGSAEQVSAGPGAAAAGFGPSPNRLIVSTASPEVVQRQLPPGSCRTIGHGLYARPDPRCTPGAINPAVTPTTIDRTICAHDWTERVRPPEWVTEAEKRASLAAYGDRGPLHDYEYDHLVPLELGGAVNDPRNLWPEPGASPNPKDAVEDRLRAKVCDGRLALRTAQAQIARDWVVLRSAVTSSLRR
jgi:hypothetical protein